MISSTSNLMRAPDSRIRRKSRIYGSLAVHVLANTTMFILDSNTPSVTFVEMSASFMSNATYNVKRLCPQICTCNQYFIVLDP